jgi:hypothetical protein
VLQGQPTTHFSYLIERAAIFAKDENKLEELASEADGIVLRALIQTMAQRGLGDVVLE